MSAQRDDEATDWSWAWRATFRVIKGEGQRDECEQMSLPLLWLVTGDEDAS